MGEWHQQLQNKLFTYLRFRIIFCTQSMENNRMRWMAMEEWRHGWWTDRQTGRGWGVGVGWMMVGFALAFSPEEVAFVFSFCWLRWAINGNAWNITRTTTVSLLQPACCCAVLSLDEESPWRWNDKRGGSKGKKHTYSPCLLLALLQLIAIQIRVASVLDGSRPVSWSLPVSSAMALPI